MLRHYYPYVKDFFVIIYAHHKDDPVIEEATSILDKLNLKPYKVAIEEPFNWNRVTELYNETTSLKPEEWWIVADDDIVSSNAINSVHFAVEKNFNLIIINWAVYSKNLKHKLFDEILDTRITFSSDKNFILKKFGTSLSFISSIIFQKKLFNEKNLTLYDKFAPYGLSFLTFVPFVFVFPLTTSIN